MGCKYKDKCPSATGLCKVKQFDDSCFDFLESVGKHLQSYIDIGSTPKELTQLKAEKVGEWVSAGNGITTRTICSNCRKEKNGLGYTKYCSECGAKMKKEENQ